MTAYGTANQGSRLLRPDAPRVRLTGIDERLNTPGLAIPAPVSQGANTAAQILALIEQVGGTANAANSYVRQGQADERRRQAEIEERQREQQRIDNEAATVMRGKAVLDFTPIVAERETAILTGKEPVPTDIRAYAERLVRDAAGGETSEAYIESATRYTIGQLAQTAQRKNIENIRATDEQIRASYAAAAFSEPGRAAEVAADLRAKFKGLPEGQQLAPIAEAADRASRTGDRKAYEALAAVLPDSFAIQKDIYKNQLAAAEANRVRLRVEAAEADIGNSRYAKDYAGALAKLDRYHDKGKGVLSDGDKANSIRKGIEDEQRAELTQAKKINIEAVKDSVKSSFLSDVDAMASAGELSRVSNFERRVEMADGESVKVSMTGDEAARLVMDARFARNDGIPPDQLKPELYKPSFSPKNIDEAQKNGYVIPQWVSGFRAAGQSISTMGAMIADGKPLPDTASPQVLSGFRDYKTLRAVNKNAPLKYLDDNTRGIFEAAVVLQQFPQVGNTNAVSDSQAIISATQAASGKYPYDQERLKKSVTQLRGVMLSRVFTGGPKNAGEIVARLAPYASQLAVTMEPTEASERAVELFEDSFVDLNGHYQLVQPDFPGALKEQLPSVFNRIADEYVEKYGKKYGIDREDLTLRPDPENRTWMLWDGSRSIVARADTTSDVVFGYGDLWKAATRKNEAEKVRIAQEQELRQKLLADEQVEGLSFR